MLQNHKKRHEVLISGLGGQGVVTIARLLIESAMEEYPHAFFFPS
jgi:Pyruvate/2-oxoacid:ferredoxin oxidoreductase gamma subunit